MEWIIVDDGSDDISDLLTDITFIRNKYIRCEPTTISAKRNIAHSHCTGSIIVNMDDDDYYPPERVSHAVEMLLNGSELIAGCSELHIRSRNGGFLFQCGPYGKYHGTAATMAYKIEYLKNHKYDEFCYFGEEKSFTNNYSEPMIQLDPLKTILVISHIHNSCDKEKALENKTRTRTSMSRYTTDDFIKNSEYISFYDNKLNDLLVHYSKGDPIHKKELNYHLKMKETETKKIENIMKVYEEKIKEKDQEIASKNKLISQLIMKLKSCQLEMNST